MTSPTDAYKAAIEAAAVFMPWLWPLVIARRLFMGDSDANRN